MRPIMALDASGKTGGVCVLVDGAVAYEEVLDEGLTHSQTLLPLAMRALEQTALPPAGVGAYAITAGPGSFTGLRIGLALVKGLALPHATPVAPVSTLKALALASGRTGTVLATLNARRGEVYWAAFSCVGSLQRLTQDAAGPAESLRAVVDAAQPPVFFVGDGAEICYTIFNYHPNVAAADEPKGLNIAKGAALLALGATVLDAPVVFPRYLRLSQAERERAETQRKAAQKEETK